ncbi:MAG TPA: phospholipid carrier-dependent glycosyltransferase [Patescibacteria group bacterium]|nr:phospholipid carrier-dependent glycosyltransferase [Patescibacteria group bacterium]
MKKITRIFLLIAIILLGGFLRFYKLNWGQGYYFHPDEYHIVIAVSRLSSQNLNPQLFSYGSFIVYLIYATQKILVLTLPHLSQISPFIIGRFYSALFSTLTIPIVYLVSKKLFKKKMLALATAFVMATIPGAIQQAHFLTPESTLTFFLLTTLFFYLSFCESKSIYHLAAAGACLGFATGTKITGLTLFPLIFVFIISERLGLLKKLLDTVVFFVSMFITFFISFPYSILDFQNFSGVISYESGVATGSLPVFYTRSFENTKPLLFQLTKILPFTVGPTVLIFFIIGFLLATFMILKNPAKERILIIVLSYFAILFFPNSFLFAKWTRFINPAFPLIVVFSVWAYFAVRSKLKNGVLLPFAILYFFPTIIWAFMFFGIYLKSDVRVQATSWINENIPENSSILTEGANTLEVPLAGNYYKNTFDFYNLEESGVNISKLSGELSKADYFIIQSRRVYLNHNKENFPHVANFYKKLFSGELGFNKVASLSSFPELKIGSFNLFYNDEVNSEETFTVFDHPVVTIYKKTVGMPEQQLYEILNKTV